MKYKIGDCVSFVVGDFYSSTGIITEVHERYSTGKLGTIVNFNYSIHDGECLHSTVWSENIKDLIENPFLSHKEIVIKLRLELNGSLGST